jgi:hypothetical protein
MQSRILFLMVARLGFTIAPALLLDTFFVRKLLVPSIAVLLPSRRRGVGQARQQPGAPIPATEAAGTGSAGGGSRWRTTAVTSSAGPGDWSTK